MSKFIAFLMTAVTFLTNLFGLNMNITITDVGLQRVNGFGTSAAWWAQMIDDDETRTKLAKALFSEKGLGLNIYRYNVGAGVNPEKNRIGEESRRTESFYYLNEETGEFEFDFSRDANAQAMLFEALSYGCVDTVVLFANSPHWSMTKNGEPAGSVSGGETNIDESRYQDFVDYFLTITEYFLEKGVPVKYISPINEPQWDWGGDWVGQEGCHYSPEEAEKLLELFAAAIKEKNLPVKLMAPESGQIGWQTSNYIDPLRNNPTIDSEIGAYAYHSYWSDLNFEEKVNHGKWRNENFKGVDFDMSEWCELPCAHDVNDVKAAVIMARIIASDFSLEYCNSWSSWVAVNLPGRGEDGRVYSDGLFYSTDGSFDEVAETTRYAALAHFSKFIPAGSYMLRTLSNKYEKKADGDLWHYDVNYAAFRTPEGKKVLVIVNEDEAQGISISGFGPCPRMEVWTTDSTHTFEKTYSGIQKPCINVEKDSITTVVLG